MTEMWRRSEVIGNLCQLSEVQRCLDRTEPGVAGEEGCLDAVGGVVAVEEAAGGGRVEHGRARGHEVDGPQAL